MTDEIKGRRWKIYVGDVMDGLKSRVLRGVEVSQETHVFDKIAYTSPKTQEN